MDPSRKPLQYLVWAALLATIIGIATAFVWSQISDARAPELPVISQLPDFVLTNQDSQPFTKSSLLGHVTVTDIIFTRCGGPCPEMTRKMSALQQLLRDPAVHLLTLTTDPGYDTPAVLKEWASRFKADFSKWSFVTGPKPEIARLAIAGLKLVAEEKPSQDRTSAEDLFIHSTIFVLVDKQGRLRGPFDSTDSDFEKRLGAAVKKLLKERGP